MDAYLPAALLHLREAEIVRVCGLARAARGQEYARTDKVRQAERVAGTLQGTVVEGQQARVAAVRFSESDLESWECSCSPVSAEPTLPADALPPDQAPPAPDIRQPCEHVAALLYLWVRTPEAFRVSDDGAPQQSASGDSLDAGTAPPIAPASTEAGATRGLPLVAPPSLAASGAEGSGAAKKADQAPGAADPLAHLPRVLPLAPLVSSSSEGEPGSEAPAALPLEAELHAAQASARLPALLLLVAALAVDRTISASGEASSFKPGLDTSSSQPAQAGFVAPQRLKVRASGAGVGGVAGPNAALLKRWAQQLDIPPEQARFCFALLRLMGLLPAEPPAGRPVFSHDQARETLLRAWQVLLARHPVEVLRDLFTHWLHAPSARELMELRDAGVRVAWRTQREAARSTDIAAENQTARQFVVDLLRRVPVGRWWNFGALVDAVWRFQPDFLRGHQQLFLRPQWWLERLPDGQPLALERRADWRQGEGRYLALLVRRALHWLGALDLALDTQGRLKGFRITPLGALLLGMAPDGADASDAPDTTTPPVGALTSALQLLEDGRLLAPLANLNETALETLLCWCAPGGATAAGLRFLPDAERVAAALDSGQSLEAWLAWLEQGEPRPALRPLIEQMQRWAARYGHVRLYESATLLEVADVALLPELEAALNLSAQFIDHPLAPGLAVLRTDAAEALAAELRRRGYDPWITNDETAH